MTTPIKAIETHYAGCRFRSRLEARWGVFFDAMGIEWHYEPQGYVIDGTPYLPDFWLANLGCWAEVKGTFDVKGFNLVAAAACTGLPAKYTATPAGAPVPRLPTVLLLGDLPEAELNQAPHHWLVRPGLKTADTITATLRRFVFAGLTSGVPALFEVDADVVADEVIQSDGQADKLLRTEVIGPPLLTAKVADAYRQARSARFEHGESPNAPARPSKPDAPSPAPTDSDPATLVEREALKLAIQESALAGSAFDALGSDVYLRPLHVTVRDAVTAAGGARFTAGGADWVAAVRDACCDDAAAKALVSELSVEPLRVDGDPDPQYVTSTLARLQLHAVNRRIEDVKAKLMQVDPNSDTDEHMRIFGELVELHRQARDLGRAGGFSR